MERIDGAPVLSERITAYLSEESDKLFYFNQKYLLEYHSVSSQEAKKMVPGASYFAKLLGFFHSHYRVGELFMEFVKFACKDDNCHFCCTWSGIPVQRIPQPVPDPLRPGHYQSVSTTYVHLTNLQTTKNMTYMSNTVASIPTEKIIYHRYKIYFPFVTFY